MTALAMSYRGISKTYSRSAQKEDPASKAFDEIISGKSKAPNPVKAATTATRWGKTTFTSTRGILNDDTRKRLNSDSEDDPFSFSSEDVGPSKPKRGMGFKLAEKNENEDLVIGKKTGLNGTKITEKKTGDFLEENCNYLMAEDCAKKESSSLVIFGKNKDNWDKDVMLKRSNSQDSEDNFKLSDKIKANNDVAKLEVDKFSTKTNLSTTNSSILNKKSSKETQSCPPKRFFVSRQQKRNSRKRTESSSDEGSEFCLKKKVKQEKLDKNKDESCKNGSNILEKISKTNSPSSVKVKNVFSEEECEEMLSSDDKKSSVVQSSPEECSDRSRSNLNRNVKFDLNKIRSILKMKADTQMKLKEEVEHVEKPKVDCLTIKEDLSAKEKSTKDKSAKSDGPVARRLLTGPRKASIHSFFIQSGSQNY